MNSSKKVVFFFSGSGAFRYGVAEVFRHVLNGLHNEDYQLYLIITGALDGPVDDLAEEVEIVELGKDGLKNAFLPLVKAVRRIRPDIVVSAVEHPNVLATLARLVSLHHCKLILTSHGILSERLTNMWSPRQGWMIRNALQFFYPLAEHVVCVSNAVRDDLKKHVPRLAESSVIYNPALRSDDLPIVEFNEKESGLIVASSRLVDFKKIDEAIHAIQFLEEPYHLVVMGDGPERGRLEALVSELGLDDRVDLVGYVNDTFSWYRKAEIFVHPSMWEGFPLVLIESMASGCQVVANSAAAGSAEALGYGKYGFLYEGGHPENLALKIREASGSPKSLEKVVEYAQKFTDQRVARRYKKLIDQLLKNV